MTIYVTTQAGLDEALVISEPTRIEIRSPRGVVLEVRDSKSHTVTAWGSSTVYAYGSSTVTAYGSSRIVDKRVKQEDVPPPREDVPAIKKGDRVKVEFEAEVEYVGQYNNKAFINLLNPFESSDVRSLLIIPKEAITKLTLKLPTTIGSVVRITDWYGPEDWTATLGGDENWHISQDSSGVFYSPTDFLLANPTWETIYVPGATK